MLAWERVLDRLAVSCEADRVQPARIAEVDLIGGVPRGRMPEASIPARSRSIVEPLDPVIGVERGGLVQF